MGEGEELMFLTVETTEILAGRRQKANETGRVVFGKVESEGAEGRKGGRLR